MRTGWIARNGGMGYSGIPHYDTEQGEGEMGLYGISYPFQHNATQRNKILTLDKHWQST